MEYENIYLQIKKDYISRLFKIAGVTEQKISIHDLVNEAIDEYLEYLEQEPRKQK